MPEYAQTVTYLFAVASILLNIMVVFALLSRVTMGVWLPPSVRGSIERVALVVAACFSLGAVGLSLWYSEVVGVPVCALCWFARTMMFPLALILWVAVYRKELAVRPYALALAIAGMLITGYHHLLQIGAIEGSICSALRDGGDCAKRYIYEFDWVTMPWLGFTLFSTVFLLVLLARSEK